MRKLYLLTFLILCFLRVLAQTEAPNFSNQAAQVFNQLASGGESNGMNLFTGQPSISIPLHAWSGNGMGFSVNLSYATGGIRVGQESSMVGLGWQLDAGGAITRTVRGLPDDVPAYGYMFAPPIPIDFRPDASRYYYDSLDAQPDVFQLSVPGFAGKFFIAKNGKVVTVPKSAVRIFPSLDHTTGHARLRAFKVLTTDGTAYDFDLNETNSTYTLPSPGALQIPSGIYGVFYSSAWHLSRIVSPFNADTIALEYESIPFRADQFPFPQVAYADNATGARSFPKMGAGETHRNAFKISKVRFPDKTELRFVYSSSEKYDDKDFVLSKVTVWDTILRHGYNLVYLNESRDFSAKGIAINRPIRTILQQIIPFVPNRLMPGYSFSYVGALPKLGSWQDTLQNKRDHWGFYNGAYNKDTLVPRIKNYNWGANREPGSYVLEGMLSSIRTPLGGAVLYVWEPNERSSYQIQPVSLTLPASLQHSGNVLFMQSHTFAHRLQVWVDASVIRSGTPPVTGPGLLQLKLKSPDGTIVHKQIDIPLRELYQQGVKAYTFSLPGGYCLLQTELAPGSGISGSFPIRLEWENKASVVPDVPVRTGGVRIKSIWATGECESCLTQQLHFDYKTEDGLSSGFLGQTPRYDHPLYEIYPSGYNPQYKNFTVVHSDPVSAEDYWGGALNGYSRVEVSRGLPLPAPRLGKTVHEFTDLNALADMSPVAHFPYVPQNLHTWAMGLPKRTSMYDSAGRLLQRTVQVYNYDTAGTENSQLLGLKTGVTSVSYLGNPMLHNTPRTRQFAGEFYYPGSGVALLTALYDTVFHANGSYNASWKTFEYDTCWQLKKTVSPFDKNRNLTVEERLYYPYDYAVGGGIGALRAAHIKAPVVSSETWISGDGNPRLAAGSVQTFRTLSNGLVRPDTSYAYRLPRATPLSSAGVFNPALPVRNPGLWEAVSHVAVYDPKGRPLETKAIRSGRSASVILSNDGWHTIASAANATASDIAYTSFEPGASGGWSFTQPLHNHNNPKTGNRVLNLNGGHTVSRNGLSPSKTYTITFWYASLYPYFNGTYLTPVAEDKNGWKFYSHTFSGVSTVTLSGVSFIDELRLHPANATMTSAVMEPFRGVTSTSDANNTIGHIEYDLLGRPAWIRDGDRNILKRYEYGDSTMPFNTVPNWVFQSTVCAQAGGGYDSLYKDMNTYSESYGTEKRAGFLANACACNSTLPEGYALINDNCELGTKYIVSNAYVKICSEGSCVWRWRCRYYYQWSNGNVSQTYTVYSNSSGGCAQIIN